MSDKKTSNTPKSVAMKTKIVDALPKKLQKNLQRAPLNQLTFKDLDVVRKALDQLWKDEPRKFLNRVPVLIDAPCWHWP